MTSFPNLPKLLKGGIVLIDPGTSAVKRIIALQYNPDTLSRTLQVKGVGAYSTDRSEALRLKGPPTETIKLEIEMDTTDQLERGEARSTQLSIYPQLAALGDHYLSYLCTASKNKASRFRQTGNRADGNSAHVVYLEQETHFAGADLVGCSVMC